MKFYNTVDINDNSLRYSDARSNSVDVTVVSTLESEIYSFTASEYVGAKFLVRVTTSSGISLREILALHNGTDGYITEYAILYSHAELENDVFSLTVESGNAVLKITPTTDSSRDIKIFAQLIT
jgi:hypothetical protein